MAIWGALLPAAGSIISGLMGAKGQAAAGREQARASRYGTDIEKEIALKNLAQRRAEFAKQFGLAEKQFGASEEERAARRAAYEAALGRAGTQFGEATTGFESATGAAPPELAELEQDILAGGTEAMGETERQLAASLAQRGIRGGQAATQLRRGIGEVGIQTQRDVNRLRAEEAMRRRAERAAFEQALALQAQRGTQMVM